jgi:NAD(P)-dependent dehydrogenase (short-subunit alcohol dehydrogenase family)
MENKKIFITGAASGIGKETALLFARKGWFVGLYDINERALSQLQQTIGDSQSCFKRLDVTDSKAVREALDHFVSNSDDRLDVLFNCAGILRVGPYESIELSEHHHIVDVNVKGVMNCTYLALPFLKKAEGARVINMSSASAMFGTPDFATYSATKFWIRGFTEALNIEWERFGISVSDVMPPFVDTPMVQNVRQSKSMERLGINLTPEMLAEVVWKVAHGKKIHWPVSLQFKILYHTSKCSPTWMNRLTMKWIAGY